MNKLKKLLLVSLISALAAAFILPVSAGPEESLQIQVSTPLVSISLTPDSISFGTVSLGQEKEASVYPSVINNGSVSVDVDMKGSNAVHGDNTWTLSDVGNEANQYMLRISKSSNWETGVLNLSTTYKDFHDPLTSEQSFHVKILMPKTTSAYGEYTTQITVLATESGI